MVGDKSMNAEFTLQVSHDPLSAPVLLPTDTGPHMSQVLPLSILSLCMCMPSCTLHGCQIDLREPDVNKYGS